MNDFLRRLRRFDERAEYDVRAKEYLLKSAGWTYSSDYPGSLWLWSKAFPKSTVQGHPAFTINGATTEVALRIEVAWQDLWV